MEAVIFSGLQAAGKSSFYRERFFSSHVRISLDLLKTRNRERRMLEVCWDTHQRFVIDNTNPTPEDRARYIAPAREAGFRVIGYYFRSSIEECAERNRGRSESVPEAAIRSTAKKLILPSLDEGFDELWYVRVSGDAHTGGAGVDFVVEPWNDEV